MKILQLNMTEDSDIKLPIIHQRTVIFLALLRTLAWHHNRTYGRIKPSDLLWTKLQFIVSEYFPSLLCMSALWGPIYIKNSTRLPKKARLATMQMFPNGGPVYGYNLAIYVLPSGWETIFHIYKRNEQNYSSVYLNI